MQIGHFYFGKNRTFLNWLDKDLYFLDIQDRVFFTSTVNRKCLIEDTDMRTQRPVGGAMTVLETSVVSGQFKFDPITDIIPMTFHDLFNIIINLRTHVLNTFSKQPMSKICICLKFEPQGLNI